MRRVPRQPAQAARLLGMRRDGPDFEAAARGLGAGPAALVDGRADDGVTVVAFEGLSVATVLPVVSRQLGDLRLYGWVFSAFFLSSIVGIVVSGALSDKRGIGWPLIGGLIIFAAGLAIAGTATSVCVLVAKVAISGASAQAVPATAYAIGPHLCTAGATHHVRHSGHGLGGARFARASLAAQVASHLGWRWVFLGLVPLVGLACAVTVPRSGRSRPSLYLTMTLPCAAGAAVTSRGAGRRHAAGRPDDRPAAPFRTALRGGRRAAGARPAQPDPAGTFRAGPGCLRLSSARVC